MEYYQHLDLPTIPTDLLEQLDFSKGREFILDYGEQFHRGTQKVYAPKYVSFHLNNPELEQWIRQNISVDFSIKYILQVQTTSTHPTQCEMIPHVDMIRPWALNYYWESGGEDTELTWYQQQGYPLVRQPRTLSQGLQTREGPVAYDQLTEVASVHCRPNNWYKIRTDILHGVKNVTGVRKFLAISDC